MSLKVSLAVVSGVLGYGAFFFTRPLEGLIEPQTQGELDDLHVLIRGVVTTLLLLSVSRKALLPLVAVQIALGLSSQPYHYENACFFATVAVVLSLELLSSASRPSISPVKKFTKDVQKAVKQSNPSPRKETNTKLESENTFAEEEMFYEENDENAEEQLDENEMEDDQVDESDIEAEEDEVDKVVTPQKVQPQKFEKVQDERRQDIATSTPPSSGKKLTLAEAKRLAAEEQQRRTEERIKQLLASKKKK